MAKGGVDHSRAGTALGDISFLEVLGEYSKTLSTESMLKVGIVGKSTFYSRFLNDVLHVIYFSCENVSLQWQVRNEELISN